MCLCVRARVFRVVWIAQLVSMYFMNDFVACVCDCTFILSVRKACFMRVRSRSL